MMRIALGPVLVASLATACVSGTEVFDPDRDGGPPAPCARPAPELRLRDTVDVSSSYVREDGSLDTVCLPRTLAASATATVDCDVEVLLSEDGPVTACDELEGLAAAGTRTFANGETLVLCHVVHRTSDTGVGWRYRTLAEVEPGSAAAEQCFHDWFPDEPERTTGVLDFSGVELAPGARMSWSCEAAVPEAANSIGAPCMPTDADANCGALEGASPRDSRYLACDPETDQCNLACRSDADCTDAGLDGDRCGTHGFCVPPVCG